MSDKENGAVKDPMPTEDEWARHLDTHEKISDRLDAHGDRIAVLEAQDRSILNRLSEGAKSMAADRERAAKEWEKLSDKLDDASNKTAEAFTAIHQKYGPKPWTLKRMLAWGLGAGLPIVMIFISTIYWAAGVSRNDDIALKMRSVEQNMHNEVVETQKAIQTIEIRQAVQGESLGAIKASQERVDKQLENLDSKLDLLIRATKSTQSP